MSSHHKVVISSLLIIATLGLSACNSSTEKLSKERVSTNVHDSYIHTGRALNEANSQFYLIDTVIAALHKKIEDPSLTHIECLSSQHTTVDSPRIELSLVGDKFSASFQQCTLYEGLDSFYRITGDIDLKLDNVSLNGFILDFSGQLDLKDLAYSRRDSEIAKSLTNYSVELRQYSNDNYNSSTEVIFTTPLILDAKLYDILSTTITFEELTIIRQLDYRLGQHAISYDGLLKSGGYNSINQASISTITPITTVRNRVTAGEIEFIDNLNSVLNIKLEETTEYAIEDYEANYIISAEVENYGAYTHDFSRANYVFPINREHRLSFTARNHRLNKQHHDYNYYETPVGLEAAFCMQSLSTQILINAPQKTARIAIMPIPVSPQQLNLEIVGSDGSIVNPSLYSVSLADIWLNVEFQEGALSDQTYYATINDVFGHEICASYPIAAEYFMF
ncbi:hypothetical protein [Agarivorans albus]|uniref:Lipoprotein n=1 Tax=Agarivorans albus MKT 106 TaxID=1331007 RepID=R9PSY6_AGAAL|nr:hypothetical protein [Agarivorans albus]GAD01486.1 hypothetical protein AALB_1566 [Agarivorans albus MKT 106]